MIARVLWRLVVLNLIVTLEYRATFLVYMVNNAVVPVVSLLVWLAVLEHGASLPLGREQLVTYYVLLGVVAMLTSSWLSDYLAHSIRVGEISPWLLRPAPYILGQVANNLAEKLVKLTCLLPMIAVVVFLLRAPLRLPTDPLTWGLFLVALLLAATVTFLLDVLIGLLAFWMDDVRGVSRVRTLVAALLSGQVVPLAFFPDWLSGFLLAQPFRYALSFPLEVLVGGLSQTALAFGFLMQVSYAVAFSMACRLLWSRGLRAYSATGA